MINKTRVLKYKGRWYVLYTLPYSGRLTADFATWQEAWDDAMKIEEQRQWT